MRITQPESDVAGLNASELRAVHIRAFGQPDEADIVQRIRTARDFDPGLSFVAIEHDRIVGHILFSPITIESPNGQTPALALGPMAVLPEHQRQGIGSALVRHGIDACQAAGQKIIVVLGHAAFYRRFDFTPARRHNIQPPFDAPDDAWLVRGLSPDALAGVSGTVRYPPPWGI